MSTQSITPEVAPKPMSGKYDGRRNNGRYVSKVKRGPKPFYERNLGKNTAAKLFRELSVKEQFAQILACDDLRLRFQALCYLWDRLEGKPFVATNPAEVKNPTGISQDNRLQVAIQQLVVAPAQSKSHKRKVLEAKPVAGLPAGDPEAIEAAAKAGGLK